ncbi:MAG TPA: DUF4340 domain-containing protein [Isosphaeraceae bacterium]|nr:DUF4340 domain-containing protein [Isosphaeraceae bacterium]
MKSNRTTIILLILFFGGLLTMWGLQVAGVRTNEDERRRADWVLPDLINTPAEEIRRVEVDRGDEHLVFERRGRGPGRWQMVEPLDVAAEPTRLETLVRNLHDLRKSPQAGTIEGEAATFGLDPPAATVRLFAGTDDRPVATLDIGKTNGGIRYVRPVGSTGIEVADAKLLTPLDQPVTTWRQPVVMGVPTFQVASVTITRRRPGEAGKGAKPVGPEPQVIRAERQPSGRWRLTAPLAVPANGAKIESLLAALASLRVLDIPKGFVADNVKDFTPFGLTEPRFTVELKTDRPEDEPVVLDVGKLVPDQPDRAYVRQGGQDDVVVVNAKALGEIPESPTSLRSQQVTELVPGAVTAIEVRTRSDIFRLTRDASGWELTSPTPARADTPAVQAFLNQLANLQSSEFLEPEKVPDQQLDPPVMAITIRQAGPGPVRRGAPAAERSGPTSVPVLSLQLGRHDILRKTIFARLEGDRVLLALPDTLMEVLPKNPYAFRDRNLLTEKLESIRKVRIRRGGRTDELEPNPKGEPNQWRMRAPVDAPADVPTITQALAALANLRVDDIAAGSIGDGKAFGLDRPLIEVDWESDRAHRLKIGGLVPRSQSYYASLDEQPLVFTLGAATARLFDAEFRDHRVLSFGSKRAERVLLRWPYRTVALRRRQPPPSQGQVEWVPDPGTEAEGLDLSRISALVKTLGQLQTTRYFQYEGPYPATSGLPWPRLVVEVTLAPGGPNLVLRIGSPTVDGQVCAATGTGDSGPGFFLPGASWNDLIHSGERFAPIPDNPFAPAP